VGPGFFRAGLRDEFHEVRFSGGLTPLARLRAAGRNEVRMSDILPVLLFVGIAAAVSVGLLVFAQLVGPKRSGAVKEMPYESGMDPIHDTRRRFDVRFHLVAITFLVFDVELLFLYPWAVASRSRAGIDAAVAGGLVSSRGLVFAGAMLFIALVIVGFAYDWRKGVFRWR